MKKWSICLLAAAALVAFAVPATSSAAGATSSTAGKCPKGQIGTPPYCATPYLKIKGFQRSSHSCTVTFVVNAAGKVKFSGEGVQAKTEQVQPGTGTITVELTAKSKELLKETGKLKLSLTTTYFPTGGSKIAKTRLVTFHVKKS